ncbi:MAG TPA: hypothetical protein VF407_20880 [Polyangiaceae bacterium]
MTEERFAVGERDDVAAFEGMRARSNVEAETTERRGAIRLLPSANRMTRSSEECVCSSGAMNEDGVVLREDRIEGAVDERHAMEASTERLEQSFEAAMLANSELWLRSTDAHVRIDRPRDAIQAPDAALVRLRTPRRADDERRRNGTRHATSFCESRAALLFSDIRGSSQPVGRIRRRRANAQRGNASRFGSRARATSIAARWARELLDGPPMIVPSRMMPVITLTGTQRKSDRSPLS